MRPDHEIAATASQIAMEHGINPDKIDGKWRAFCPVCGTGDALIFYGVNRFYCGFCGVHGDAELLKRILDRLEVMACGNLRSGNSRATSAKRQR